MLFILAGACVGLVLGTSIGGNYFIGFEFADVRGYEAKGNLGLMIRAELGLILGKCLYKNKWSMTT